MLGLFTLGVLAGSLVGLFSPAVASAPNLEGYVASEALSRSLPGAFWDTGKFFLLLFAVATSYLGVILSPAAVFLRGYLFSCSVSALFSAYAYRGLLCAALISGVPALFLIPCFLSAASAAFFSARRLATQRFDPGPGLRGAGLSRRVVVIVLLLILDALYRVYLLPVLLSRI